jgi:hypothetical protein
MVWREGFSLGFVFLLSAVAHGQNSTTTNMETLKTTPKTVAWGYYDAKAAPILRAKSGDTVEIQTPVAAISAQEKNQPIVYVKHLEPPLDYPPVARVARLRGTIAIKLKIAANGIVLSAESSAGDKSTTGFDILKADAERLLKTWTFGCVGCMPDVPFEHTIRFRFEFDDDPTVQDLMRVTMNLPDEVTIISSTVRCDHCSSSEPSKKGNH